LKTERYETAAARGYDLIKSEDPNLALLLALALLHPKEPDGDAIEALAYKALEFLGLREFLHLKEVDDSAIERAIERLPYKVLEFLGLKKFLHLKEVDDSAIERLAYKALQTPRPKAVLSAQAAFPTATFSPDGQLLLISRGNAFQVWKAIDEIELVVREFRPREVSAGRRAVWSGQWIVGATGDSHTALFAPCSVPALRKYFQQCANKNEDDVRIIGERDTASWPSTLSPTRDRLLTGGSGRPPQLWDIGPEPAKLLFPFKDGPANSAIAFNQQGDRLALGSADGSVRIYETANPAKGFITTLRPRTPCDASGENPSVQVFSVAFNPGKDKGDEMVSTTLDGCLRLWNVKEQVKEQTPIADHNLKNTGFFSASFDPSGQRIAMTSDDGSVRIWEPGNPDKPDLILRGNRSATWTVEFSRETGLLASASSESVRIWTLTPALHPSALPAAPDLSDAVRSCGFQDGTLDTGERGDVTLDDPSACQNVVAAAVSKDGNRVLVAEKEKTLKLYDLSASQAPVAKFEVPGVEWKAVGFLSEPDRMVGETTKGEFYAWPFFKDRDALIEFAEKSLPVDQNLETIELSQADKCRFGVETKSPPCPEY
jgi:WD40 repeat protein